MHCTCMNMFFLKRASCFVAFKVAKVNPRDSSYLLRDDFYKHVQKDWPGYSDDERQLISRMLARWVGGTSWNTLRMSHLS